MTASASAAHPAPPSAGTLPIPEALLARLNPKQEQAVRTLDGPLLMWQDHEHVQADRVDLEAETFLVFRQTVFVIAGRARS